MESENIIDSWEEGDDHDYYIDQELDGEGSKYVVYRKINNISGTSYNTNYPCDISPSMYLAWYLISHYVKPDNIGAFAKINRTTRSFTKTDHFWRNIYKVYCEGDSRLPDKLVLDNKCKINEIREKVIRALYYTYDNFIKKAIREVQLACKPQDLVNKKCVYISFDKKIIGGQPIYYYLFKFKKETIFERGQVQLTNNVQGYQILQNGQTIVLAMDPKYCDGLIFTADSRRLVFFIPLMLSWITEWIVLQQPCVTGLRVPSGRQSVPPLTYSAEVTCGKQNNVPPVMNMYLTSVSSTTSMFTEKHYSMARLYFGTNPSSKVPRLQEDVLVQLLSVKRFTLFNWWHPQYRT